ncbi:hypothetical protein UFOVP699_13 [uncultured Caudovirales phage]|uniref:Uncharacterized protein n=1 Tax=uncultured Caudovirales phage TaxID=2100421 RepID=A0A6J5NHQ6_9CAUD|nr:hypothetical protein UFOVP699_13 [uncultured Caudovirales phage]
MPIRVNLKEIFTSDPQEITIEKVNFNFNKLLELGIGEQGERGFSGTQGPAGPGGVIGPAGLRGSTWFVDNGDPNFLTGFDDLIDGDLYLDSSTLSIYQYDATADNWILVADISAIVNNYISQGASPFVRGIGLTSPADDRFIVFNRRGNDFLDSQLDVSRGLFNSANSDVLFLNNFNEDTLADALLNFEFPDPVDLFASLLKIHVNHTDPAAPILGRYHIELGSVYEDPSDSKIKLTDLNQNLKVKFFKNDVHLTTNIPTTNYWINTARFSLSVPEPDPIFNITQNAIFEFATPKINIEGTPQYAENTIRFGSEEAFIEYASAPTITGDGIMLTTINESGNDRSFSLGIKKDLAAVLNLPYYANEDFAMINISDDLEALFINNDLIQSNGNILQLQTQAARYKNKIALSNSALAGNSNSQLAAIFSNSRYLIQSRAGANSVNSATANEQGLLEVYQVYPEFTLLTSISSDSIDDATAPIITDNHLHPLNPGLSGSGFPATNITSIDFVGKYGYLTRVKPQISNVAPPPNLTEYYSPFIIFELDSNGYNLIKVSPNDNTIAAYNNLYQVKVVNGVAFLLSRKRTGGNWSQPKSYLITVDVSDPTQTRELDIYDSASATTDIYLTFDVSEEKAVVVSNNSVTGNLDLIVLDVHDTSSIQFISSISETAPVSGFPTLKIVGRDVFMGSGNTLRYYRFDDDAQLVPIDSLVVNPTLVITDIIINGRYAYVLGENSTNKKGEFHVVDISDYSLPFVVSTQAKDELTATGKMTLIGNKVFITTSNGTGLLAAQTGGLVELELDSIISQAADLGSIKTDTLKVIGDAYIAKSLDIGQSLSIGSGGLLSDGPAYFSEAVNLSNIIGWNSQPSAYPSSTSNKIQWIINSDYAEIYAFQSASDDIDLVFKLGEDTASSADNFIYWIDSVSGEASDAYPMELNAQQVIVNPLRKYAVSGSNQDSGNTDFYILKENATSLSTGSLFFADVSASRIGILTVTPNSALQIGARWTFVDVSNTEKYISYNLYENSGTQYIASAPGSKITLNESSNLPFIQLELTRTGTAGTAPTTMEKALVATLTASTFLPRIGIGHAAPTAMLHVKGSSGTYTDPLVSEVPAVVVQNTGSTASSHAILSAQVSGASGGNPFISFNIPSALGWSVGIDNADSDKFKISRSWSNIASNTAMTIDSSNKVGVGTVSPATTLHVQGEFTLQNATPGVGKVLTCIDGTGTAQWQLPSGGGSGAGFDFVSTGTTVYWEPADNPNPLITGPTLLTDTRIYYNPNAGGSGDRKLVLPTWVAKLGQVVEIYYLPNNNPSNKKGLKIRGAGGVGSSITLLGTQNGFTTAHPQCIKTVDTDSSTSYSNQFFMRLMVVDGVPGGSVGAAEVYATKWVITDYWDENIVAENSVVDEFTPYTQILSAQPW